MKFMFIFYDRTKIGHVRVLYPVGKFKAGTIAFTTPNNLYYSEVLKTNFYLVVPLHRKLCSLTHDCLACRRTIINNCGTFILSSDLQMVDFNKLKLL